MTDETAQISKEDDLDKISILTNKIQTQLQKLTSEQKDQIGKSYLKHVLGINNQTIDAFLQDDENAKKTVSIKQNEKESVKADAYSFWREFCGINQCIYSEEEKSWLAHNIKSPKALYSFVSMMAEQSIISAIMGNYNLSPLLLKIFEITKKYNL